MSTEGPPGAVRPRREPSDGASSASPPLCPQQRNSANLAAVTSHRQRDASRSPPACENKLAPQKTVIPSNMGPLLGAIFIRQTVCSLYFRICSSFYFFLNFPRPPPPHFLSLPRKPKAPREPQSRCSVVASPPGPISADGSAVRQRATPKAAPVPGTESEEENTGLVGLAQSRVSGTILPTGAGFAEPPGWVHGSEEPPSNHQPLARIPTGVRPSRQALHPFSPASPCGIPMAGHVGWDSSCPWY